MSLNEELAGVYRRLQSDLHHQYVTSVLPEPEIDRDKLTIYYLLFRCRKPMDAAAVCAGSVMAAEIGLNTHDRVTSASLTDKTEIKKRQLTVLSGDFYSTLYYYSLVRVPDMEVVRWVAQAIQVFNERKCALIDRPHPLNWSELVAAVKKIESTIVEKIAGQLGFAAVIPCIADFFLIKRMIAVKKENLATMRSDYLSCACAEILEKMPERQRLTVRAMAADLFQGLNHAGSTETGLSLQVINYMRDRLVQLTGESREGTC